MDLVAPQNAEKVSASDMLGTERLLCRAPCLEAIIAEAEDAVSLNATANRSLL